MFFPKGSPFNCFAVFRQNGCWKIPKGPPFQFFGIVRFFSENKNFSPFNFFMFCDRMDVELPHEFLPFSFSALWDFFSKIVFLSKGSLLQFLWCFTTERVFKNPKGSPLSVFRHCKAFRQFVFSPKGPPCNCDKNVDNFGSAPPPFRARQGLALAGPGALLGQLFWFFDFRVL